jgi:hypothetical protein
MREAVATVAVVCGLGLLVVAFALSYIMGPGIALLLSATAALTIRRRPEAVWHAAPGSSRPERDRRSGHTSKDQCFKEAGWLDRQRLELR